MCLIHYRIYRVLMAHHTYTEWDKNYGVIIQHVTSGGTGRTPACSPVCLLVLRMLFFIHFSPLISENTNQAKYTTLDFLNALVHLDKYKYYQNQF